MLDSPICEICFDDDDDDDDNGDDYDNDGDEEDYEDEEKSNLDSPDSEITNGVHRNLWWAKLFWYSRYRRLGIQ